MFCGRLTPEYQRNIYLTEITVRTFNTSRYIFIKWLSWQYQPSLQAEYIRDSIHMKTKDETWLTLRPKQFSFNIKPNTCHLILLYSYILYVAKHAERVGMLMLLIARKEELDHVSRAVIKCLDTCCSEFLTCT